MNQKLEKFLFVNILINLVTILIAIQKILAFISRFKYEFFSWWLPMGKIFSFIHFFYFATFFIVPLPFGLYFLVLIFYLLTAITLLSFHIWKKTINKKVLVMSIIILIGTIGSFFVFIGE